MEDMTKQELMEDLNELVMIPKGALFKMVVLTWESMDNTVDFIQAAKSMTLEMLSDDDDLKEVREKIDKIFHEETEIFVQLLYEFFTDMVNDGVFLPDEIQAPDVGDTGFLS